jgi:glycosyltransferase involved in cell wall biosynthesis
VGLQRTAGPADSLVGFATPGPIRDFESLSRVQRSDVSEAGARPSAVRKAIAARARWEAIDVFVSPWSAFPSLDVPVVVVVHELPFVRLGPVEGRWRALAHRWWLRRDATRAAAIVVPSKATRDDVLTLHPAAASRTTVIPHGFDPTLWGVAHAAAPTSRYGRPVSRGLVVGATNRRKGLDVLLEADRLLGGRANGGTLEWTLVGAPPRALASQVARRRNFRVVAAPSDEEARRLFQSADVLVYPSRSEGFGFPPLEAMAAGCPVVASRAGAIPEVCGDAAILVEPGDPDALAAGVRSVLFDLPKRAELVARGKTRCRAFPPETSGAAWWALLRRVTAEAAA